MKKNVMLVLSTVFLWTYGSSQAPPVEKIWEITDFSSSNSNFLNCEIDANGNIVYFGSSSVGGGSDIALKCLHSNGNVLWEQNCASTTLGNDWAVDMKLDNAGNIYVTGVHHDGNKENFYTAKYAANGALMWEDIYNRTGNGDDNPAGISIDDIGNVYVTGTTFGGFTLLDQTTLKYNPQGTLLWQKHYNFNNKVEVASDIEIDNAGNILVLGTSANNAQNSSFTVIKYNPNGVQLDYKRHNTPGNGYDFPHEMKVSEDNSIHIVGTADGNSNANIKTLVLNENLQTVWVKYIDKAGLLDEGSSLIVDDNGNTIITGYSENSIGMREGVTVKYDDSGDLLWEDIFCHETIKESAKNRKIRLASDGTVLVSGYVQNAAGDEASYLNRYLNTSGALVMSVREKGNIVDGAGFVLTENNNEIVVGNTKTENGESITNIVKYEVAAAEDPLYFYLEGEKTFWTQQKGMYCFKAITGSDQTYLDNLVGVSHLEHFYDDVHYVFFSEDATSPEIDLIINQIETNNSFIKEYMVAVWTKNNGFSYNEELYAGLDDYITVVFNNPNVSSSEIETFANLHKVRLFHEPPNNIKGGVYIFEVESTDPAFTIKKSAEMWEMSNSSIKFAYPGLRVFRPDDPNDPLYPEAWYAENNGLGLCNGGPWAVDADIDLDQAWNLNDEFGYGESWSGLGVNVGVIDWHGYEWEHPDLVNVYNDGYVLPSSGSSATSPTLTQTTLIDWEAAHGQNVAGIIAANLDNNEGTAGVAFNSKVTPCLIIGGTTDAIVSGIQKLSDSVMHVGVINISSGFNAAILPPSDEWDLNIACQNAFNQGRPSPSDPSVNLGIPIIASTGNMNVDQQYYNLPSIYSFVLGVGATNPIDQVKSIGDGYAGWKSVYTEYIDVAAPGICINSTDFIDTNGYSLNDYNAFSGTSAATPIVSGVAALMLEKNPEYTANAIYHDIKIGCEKVGGYNYVGPGLNTICDELGYGRINAYNSLQLVPLLGVEENHSFDYYYNNPTDGSLYLTVLGLNQYTVEIMDISGKLIFISNELNSEQSEYNLTSYSNGMYFMKITDLETNAVVTDKIIRR